jgi:uncharacterized protein (TIGR03067 family)
MLALVCVALALPSPTQDPLAELKALAGTWKLDKAEVNGAELPREIAKEFKLIIKDSKYELFSAGPKDEGTISVDPTRKPKTMQIKGTQGPNQGKTFLAIYEVTDGLLRICYDLEGKAYPTEFSAPAQTKRFYAVYRPAKD